MEPKFREADIKDIPALVALANSAYRGELSIKGWTNETHLFSGPIISIKMLTASMASPKTTILIAEKNDIVVGCVLLRLTDKGCYLGLLTVSPEIQDSGMGRLLIENSEKWAKKQNQKKIYMQVINSRSELIAWYERRGFRRNGETLNFKPSEVDMIRPDVSLEKLNFIFLEKTL